MGSPYFVHQQAERVHVVRTWKGFKRIISIVCSSMGSPVPEDKTDIPTYSSVLRNYYGPEAVVLRDLLECYELAARTSSRRVIFLEARYEWRGWEKFQRVIVFDLTKRIEAKAIQSPDLSGASDTISWELVPYLFLPNILKKQAT